MPGSRIPLTSTRALCVGRSHEFTARVIRVFPMTDQPPKEYRVREHDEGYVVQSRAVGSTHWTDGPVFLSEEKALEAMRRLADATAPTLEHGRTNRERD